LIHISDNGFTDTTADVGQALAAAHPTVTYTRQPTNLGPSPNFRFLRQRATTQYFMWLAADDVLEPSYIERMLAVLESDPGLVTCVSQVRFERADGSSRLAGGSYPLQDDIVTNPTAYLLNPHDNARVYGLHRTVPLQRAFPTSNILVGLDYALMAGTLLCGRHAEIPEVQMVRNDRPLQASHGGRYRDFRIIAVPDLSGISTNCSAI
jgi:glycosyltransferase involved in cell wall biosynthesis